MDLVLRKLVTQLRIKMSMLTLAKTVIGGTIAGLTLLALTANSSFADTHNQTASQTIALRSSLLKADVAVARI